ncbi:prenyltransferase [Spirochaeta cellobiosiphila]|uniref:prenyltransferase n=1 Tax=Spirochaeta cellobiosiphila TaxID=504483 RepID=UPI001B7F8F7C|nr:prenyltransferase [Spirochaeta cellobiosiphila]
MEIRTKIVSVSTLLISTLYILFSTTRLSPLKLLLMVIASLAIDMGTTAFNTYFDYTKGVDHIKTNQEADKVLIHGGVSKWTAFWTAWILFLIAGCLGLILTFLTGWPLLMAGGICMLIGYFYTAGPRPISSTPFGELFAGGAMGTGIFLINIYIQKGYLTGWDLLFSIPSTLMIASILTVNNTCDREGDIQAGRKTLSILLGPSKSVILLFTEVLLAHILLLFILGSHNLWMSIPVVFVLIWEIYDLIKMKGKGFNHTRKGPSMGGITKIFMKYTFGYSTGLILLLLGIL